MTPEIISRIRDDQRRYDEDPEAYERREQQDKEAADRMEQELQEQQRISEEEHGRNQQEANGHDAGY